MHSALSKKIRLGLAAVMLVLALTGINTAAMSFDTIPSEAGATVGAKRSGWVVYKNGMKRYFVNGKYKKGLYITKNKSMYLFSKNKGYLLYGTRVYKGVTYYIKPSGRVEVYKKGGVYYYPNGTRLTPDQTYEWETQLRARKIVSQITNDSMTPAQKMLTCFNWVMEGYYQTYHTEKGSAFFTNWPATFANDHFLTRSGDCLSDAAAFAYLCKALGYTNVYVVVDYNNLEGHAWAEVNGLIYDPLFAQAKSFANNYGVTYAVYEDPNPYVKVKI